MNIAELKSYIKDLPDDMEVRSLNIIDNVFYITWNKDWMPLLFANWIQW